MVGGVDLKEQAKLADIEFVRSLKWTPKCGGRTGKAVRKAAKRGDKAAFVLAQRAFLEPFAEKFRKRVQSLKRPLAVLSLPESAPHSLSSLVATEFADARVGAGRFGLGRSIHNWLRSVSLSKPIVGPDLLLALEMLVDSPIDIEIETWLRLWRVCLVSIPEVGKKATEPDLIHAESRMMASLVFQLLDGTDELFHGTSSSLSSILTKITDTNGAPRMDVVTNLRRWLTSFVRVMTWGRSFGRDVLDETAAKRFRLFVACGADLCMRGRFAFEPPGGRSGQDVLAIGAKVAKWSAKSEVGALARGVMQKTRKRCRSIPFPAVQSDWAEVSYLRSDRSLDADLIAVGHSGPAVQIDMSCLGEDLLRGDWNSTIHIHGKVVTTDAAWTCSCWHSDHDGDYLELQQLNSGVRVERQLFLSRKQHFALVMESVITQKSQALSTEIELPLAATTMARADYISREWRVHAGDVPVRVFPVSLDFDRVQSANGELRIEAGCMRYSLQGNRTLQAAMVLDWHPKRRTSEAEWCQVTVTESRRILKAAEAAAFRLRINDHHLFSYRNLNGSTELRAVLGQHMANETMIGIFADGDVEPLVLVDFDQG